MEKQLANLQMFLFKKGSTKSHFFYDNLGNLIQNVRTKING